MGAHLRRMKRYRPRRPNIKKMPDARKTLLSMEQHLSSKIHHLIRLCEEGNISQVEALWQTFQLEVRKNAEEMKAIAEKIGDGPSRSVHSFFKSIEEIVRANPTSIDAIHIHRCYQILHRLELELKAA